MITRVQKWGNSQGLRLSKELLFDAAIEREGIALDTAVTSQTYAIGAALIQIGLIGHSVDSIS